MLRKIQEKWPRTPCCFVQGSCTGKEQRTCLAMKAKNILGYYHGKEGHLYFVDINISYITHTKINLVGCNVEG